MTSSGRRALSADWRRLSREAGLRVDSDSIEVTFYDERQQTVYVEAMTDEAIRLWSVVARPSALDPLDDPVVDAWRRNRLSEFVGFTLDRRGRMIGESWLPVDGLTPTEWSFYVFNLARACDRFEYLITGRDEA